MNDVGEIDAVGFDKAMRKMVLEIKLTRIETFISDATPKSTCGAVVFVIASPAIDF